VPVGGIAAKVAALGRGDSTTCGSAMFTVCTFSALLSSSKMTSISSAGVGNVSDGPLPSVKVSSQEMENRKTSMLREPWMKIGPGPAMEPYSVTDAKLKPPADTSKPAATRASK